MERQIVVLQRFFHVPPVHVRQEQHPQIAVLPPHIVDDHGRLVLVESQGIPVILRLGHEILEGSHHKVVVLAADEQGRSAALSPGVEILVDVVRVPQQLVPQLQQLPSLVGDDHAGGRPLKDGDVQLLLQPVHQIADAGLGDIQLLSRLAE